MRKILLLTTLSLSVFAASVKAQEKGGFKLGVGPVGAIPFGSLGDYNSIGIGGEAQAAYGITDNFAAFVQSGYSTFFGKTYTFKSPIPGIPDVSTKGSSLGFVPMLAGVRYHNSGFSIGGAIGYGLFTGGGSSSGGFAYSPQIGYSIGPVDIIAHYTGVSRSGGSASFAGLKVFINFIGNSGGGGYRGGGGRW
jgi:hypothetical protein